MFLMYGVKVVSIAASVKENSSFHEMSASEGDWSLDCVFLSPHLTLASKNPHILALSLHNNNIYILILYSSYLLCCLVSALCTLFLFAVSRLLFISF